MERIPQSLCRPLCLAMCAELCFGPSGLWASCTGLCRIETVPCGPLSITLELLQAPWPPATLSQSKASCTPPSISRSPASWWPWNSPLLSLHRSDVCQTQESCHQALLPRSPALVFITQQFPHHGGNGTVLYRLLWESHRLPQAILFLETPESSKYIWVF